MLYFDYESNNFLYFDDEGDIPGSYFPVIIDNGNLFIFKDNELVSVPDQDFLDIPEDVLPEEEFLSDVVSYSPEFDNRFTICMFLLFFLFLFTLLSRLGDHK